jgi:drug/metabolite transporter (DMT)-like permease
VGVHGRAAHAEGVTGLAFVLVLTSAALHALWNFLVKRSGASGPVFIWLFTLPSVAFIAPLAIWMIVSRHVTFASQAILFLAGSAVIHTVYFLLLSRGYRDGDLSVVYPIARGTGPPLAGMIAIATLKERPSVGAIIGALCITGGAVLLARDQRASQRLPGVSKVLSVEYGVIIGVLIGIYTVWDKFLVASLAVNPVILEWVVSGAICLFVTPSAIANLPLVRSTWKEHHTVAIAGAVLSSISYILFLTALAVSPVSRVAPLRETSILIGALLGTRILGEGTVRKRLVAAGAISAGVILVSLG